MRPLVAEDYASCLLLWASCDRTAVRMWEDPTSLMRLIDHNPSICSAAEQDGRLVGALLAGQDGARGWLYHVAVDEAWRRRGIGSSLVSRALVELAKVHIQRVHVVMLSTNLGSMRFWTAGAWRPREDLSLLSIDLDSPQLN